MTLALKILHD
jgi:NIMA (never in mitosis gene a)-related kinase 1/4/5